MNTFTAPFSHKTVSRHPSEGKIIWSLMDEIIGWNFTSFAFKMKYFVLRLPAFMPWLNNWEKIEYDELIPHNPCMEKHYGNYCHVNKHLGSFTKKHDDAGKYGKNGIKHRKRQFLKFLRCAGRFICAVCHHIFTIRILFGLLMWRAMGYKKISTALELNPLYTERLRFVTYWH